MLNVLEKDLKTWLNGNHNRLLFNEEDFQLQLATWLVSTKHYDHVELEYFVPASALHHYEWKNDLYLDIVVESDGKYAVVELKYRTQEIKKPLPRFNQIIPNTKIVKSQGADDLIKYAFWKDVRRIEHVTAAFKDVVGGFAVFVTNDPIYTKPSKPGTLKENLGMEDGVHGPNKHWPRTTNTNKNLPGFNLNSSYAIKWSSTQFEMENFSYMLQKIK